MYECTCCKAKISKNNSRLWIGLITGWVYLICFNCNYDNKVEECMSDMKLKGGQA